MAAVQIQPQICDSHSDPQVVSSNSLIKLLEDKQLQTQLLKHLPKLSVFQLSRLTKSLCTSDFGMFGTNLVQLSFDEKNLEDAKKLVHFLYQSTFRMKHVVLSNMDFAFSFGNKYLGNSLNFFTFQSKHSAHLRSVHLVKCDIKMAVFVKLFAQLTNLEELHILECNTCSMFIVGFDIFKSVHLWRKCHRNLARLKYFVFQDTEPKALKKEGGIDFMLGETHQLQHLSLLLYGKHPFPNHRFVSILTQNQNTLRTIELKKFKMEQTLLRSLANTGLVLINLKQLILYACEISSFEHFAVFLGNQFNLEHLKFQQMLCGPPCFNFIANLENLKLIFFEHCTFMNHVMKPLTRLSKLSSVFHFEGDTSCVGETSKLFQVLKSNAIKTLTFRVLDPEASKVFGHIGNNLPLLTHLDISGVQIHGYSKLIHIWKLVHLVYLNMNSCFVEETDFEEYSFEDGQTLAMKNLKKLKVLDLSHTMVNDAIVLHQIIHLKVEKLYLTDTEITVESVTEIVRCLPHLQEIDVRACYHCHITTEICDKFNNSLICTRLRCNMRDDTASFYI